MRNKVLAIALFIFCCSTVQAQEDGVVSFQIPIRNSLKYNRFLINPAFSFVREQNTTISMYNKRQWIDFENAPQTYLLSYSGRFAESQGVGLGVFQQNYGVLTTFGAVANFAHNVTLEEDSNLTFGLNIGFYKSGINTGKVITNVPDPSIDNVPSNSVITLNPGINYGTGFLDFGLSVNNLVLYNLSTSTIVEDSQRSIVLHGMHTGYLDTYGFFDGSKFQALLKTDINTEKTTISGLAMLTIPLGVWAQAGYNTLYGFSGGFGLNISPKIALEYNYESGLGNTANFGASHEIVLAYKLKSKSYDYGDEEEEGSLIPAAEVPTVVARPRAETTEPAAPRINRAAEIKAKADADAALQAQLAAAAKAKAEVDAQAKLDAEAKAKADAEAKIKADAALQAKLANDAKAKADAALQSKLAADAKLKADATAKRNAAALQSKLAADAKLKADATTKRNAAAAQAKLDADAKLKADAALQAKLAADAKLKEAADAKLRTDAETKAKLAADAKLKADAAAQAKLAADAKLKADAAAQAKLAADAKLRTDAATKAKLAADAKLKADADAKLKAEAALQAKEAADAKLKADAATKAKLAADAKLKADADAKLKADAALQAKEAADAKLRTDAATKAKLAADAKLKADADAKLKAEAALQAKEAADAKLKADADAKLKAEADAKAKADAALQVKETADAKLKAEADAKLKADADAKAKAAADLKQKADADALANLIAAAKLKADAEAKLKAEALALANKPTDENAKAIDKVAVSIERSKKEQQDLLSELNSKIASKQKELVDLKKENDLNEKGIFAEPKEFKSTAGENSSMEALKSELSAVNALQNSQIKDLELLYAERTKKGFDKKEAQNSYYLNQIEAIKKEQLKAKQTNATLEATLQKINTETEIEKNRRIKKAVFVNDVQRNAQDVAVLNRIKQTTPLSAKTLLASDFNFGEEQGNMQIVKGISTVQSGFYMTLAVHADVAKRDEFLTKTVAAGGSNVQFFYDAKTSKYYIYTDKYNSIEEAKNALENKAGKAYNSKMTIVKIENQ